MMLESASVPNAFLSKTRRIAQREVRACAAAAALAVAIFAAADPAAARTQFDGAWGILVTTQRGPCGPAYRYGVQIVDGQVIGPGGTSAAVAGRVSPSGSVRVSVRSESGSAVGSGRLSGNRGGGVWRGVGSGGACAGTWVAARQGYAPRARTGPPLYGYAPRSPWMWQER